MLGIFELNNLWGVLLLINKDICLRAFFKCRDQRIRGAMIGLNKDAFSWPTLQYAVIHMEDTTRAWLGCAVLSDDGLSYCCDLALSTGH